jgi:hypothetical protein
MATTTITTVMGSTTVEVTASTEDVIAWQSEVAPSQALYTVTRAATAAARALGCTTTDLYEAIGKQIAIDEERRIHG